MKTSYGKRGGDGPTAGKKSVVYRIEFNNGATAQKRTFKDFGPIATAQCMDHRGSSFVNRILPRDAMEQPAPEGLYWRTARRI